MHRRNLDETQSPASHLGEMGSIPGTEHVRFVVDIPYHSTNTPYSPHVPEIGSTGKKGTFMNLIDHGIIIGWGGGQSMYSGYATGWTVRGSNAGGR